MKYKNELGIFGNIKRIYEEATKTNNAVYNNKVEAERANLELMADTVEAVIDEYNSITE